MARLMRGADWSLTPLGAVETWPQSLRTVVRILLTSRYAMWMGWGRELTFLYNDAYGRMTLGAKHPWALGRPAREVWAEIWKDIGPRIQTVFEEGRATWDEGLLLFLERNGYPEETYHTFSYSPLADDNGDTGGMLCVVTEETDRILGERRLALLRDTASALAAAQTEAEVFAAVRECLETEPHDLPFSLVYLFDSEGTCANLACAAGISPDHPMARPRLDVDDADGPWPLRSILADGATMTVEPAPEDDLPTGPWDRPAEQVLIVPIAQQGQETPAGFLVAGINPYRRLDEAYSGFVGLLAGQISASLANARAYENERQRAEALAQLDHAKTTFFSNVSHEFRTPLTLMLGPLNELNAQPERFTPDVRRELALVQRNGLRLLRLVNTLLDFSRIEAGRVQAVYEATDLSAYTAELASVFRSTMEKAGLALRVDCPPLAEAVYVDREMWEKIVLNLLSNAFKFTFEGGVTVALREAGDHVELRVSDTGTGIAEKDLPHLFERFQRVEGAKGRTHEGTGIGLALVQELVKLHGGSVRVESVQGRGTTFIISVPRGRTHLPPGRISGNRSLASTALRADAYVEEAQRWLPDSAENGEASALYPDDVALPDADGPPPTSAAERARIVLADDNADMRDYVRRLLERHYRAEAVANGEEALAAIRRERPALILSDVMMPVMDGFALLQAVRSDPRLKTVPVILLSARAGEEARVEGLEVGADDYLTKPFSAKELLAVVKSHLALARFRQEAENELREIRAHLEAALSAGEIGTWSWDIATDRVKSDENLARFFHVGPEDADGGPLEHYLDAVHPEDRERLAATIQNAIEQGDPYEAECRIPQPDGSVRWLVGRGGVQRDENSVPRILVGVAMDITDRKRAEEMLHERQARIEELNARLERSVRETHHRVKNNLQLTAAMVDMYALDPDRITTSEDFRHLGSQIRALATVHDLLTTADSGDGAAGTLSAKAVLEKLLIMLRQSAPGNAITYTLEDAALPGRQANSLALLTNELVANGLKHGRGEIDVSLRVADGAATLTVQDDGDGFPDGFDSVTAAHIGLSLVESLAGMDLRGGVTYENHPEGGGLVRVVFPTHTSVSG